MKVKHLVSALALTCMACSAPVHGMSYNVMMDPSLTQVQQALVVDAGRAWEQQVPGLTISYQITACRDTGNWYNTICILIDDGVPEVNAASPTGYFFATTYWDDNHIVLTTPNTARSDSATIHIWETTIKYDNSQALFYNMTMHEMGHAFTHNSQHVTDTFAPMPNGQTHAVMFPHVGNKLEQLTSEDVAYFWAAR